MVTCVFAGHREVFQEGINNKVEEEINRLLHTDKEFVFLTGGMGNFDDMCSAAVRRAKCRHPDLNITLTLVMPYMSNKLNTDEAYYKSMYDEIVIPEESANAYYKAAIKKRNRWMVDKADFLIAYVHREFGGAYETVKYAQKQGKPVINLAE